MKLLGMINLPWKGFNFFTKIEARARMSERLARDLATEEDLQMKIQATISHNNQ